MNCWRIALATPCNGVRGPRVGMSRARPPFHACWPWPTSSRFSPTEAPSSPPPPPSGRAQTELLANAYWIEKQKNSNDSRSGRSLPAASAMNGARQAICSRHRQSNVATTVGLDEIDSTCGCAKSNIFLAFAKKAIEMDTPSQEREIRACNNPGRVFELQAVRFFCCPAGSDHVIASREPISDKEKQASCTCRTLRRIGVRRRNAEMPWRQYRRVPACA